MPDRTDVSHLSQGVPRKNITVTQKNIYPWQTTTEISDLL